MTKWILAAGAAALALTAPVVAGPGKGGDHGNGAKAHGGGEQAHGGGGGAKAARGGGGDHHGGGQARVADGGQARHADRAMARVEPRHGGQKSGEHKMARAERRIASPAKLDRHEARNFDKREARNSKPNYRDLRAPDANRFDDRRFAAREAPRYADDCPPGLAKKGNGCLPPGQAKKLLGAALPSMLASRMLEGPYRQWYRDDDRYYYRNDADYIYRVDREGGLINALFPYQDRDYSYYPVGMTYPSDYNSYNVPYQYQSFYPDGNDYNYRYGDGAIYQVNRSNNSIESIVALLAGDLGVGQTMPADYGVYNVPLAYRDRYFDTPDAEYRYNDGYIYQADPKTQLITAVIDALV